MQLLDTSHIWTWWNSELKEIHIFWNDLIIVKDFFPFWSKYLINDEMAAGGGKVLKN